MCRGGLFTHNLHNIGDKFPWVKAPEFYSIKLNHNNFFAKVYLTIQSYISSLIHAKPLM